MVSYRGLFLIKGVTFWNWIRQTGTRWKEWFYRLGVGLGGFYLGGGFPLPYRMAYGASFEWLYRPWSREIVYVGKGTDATDATDGMVCCRLDWLSAQIQTAKGEKDMDTFLDELRVWTKGDHRPSLLVVLQAWSLYDQRWWLTEERPMLAWMDREAELHQAPVGEVEVAWRVSV